uniref:Uncharacterized protein n=3 Tax=Canis lupus TaxID=9612 RepID=A0A8C0QCC7_CANLF
MEPLRGRELPPWSQAPKADALSQVSPLSLCFHVTQHFLASPSDPWVCSLHPTPGHSHLLAPLGSLSPHCHSSWTDSASCTPSPDPIVWGRRLTEDNTHQQLKCSSGGHKTLWLQEDPAHPWSSEPQLSHL